MPKRQVEQLAVRASCDFDEFYRDRLCRPEDTTHLLVLSFDAKGIATLHRDLREATRKASEATPRRLETRLTKGRSRTTSAWPKSLTRRWVVLVDGNKDQLKRIRCAARKVGVEITIVLDLVHVIEYLWRAAYEC